MKLLTFIQGIVNKYFSHQEIIILLFSLFLLSIVIMFFGDVFVPVFASIVIAYILNGLVKPLSAKISYKAAYLVVYFLFLMVFVIGIVFLLPIIWKQLGEFFIALPHMLENVKKIFLTLSKNNLIPQTHIQIISNSIYIEIQSLLKKILTISISHLPGVIAWFIYAILVPLLVFFLLKDQKRLVNSFVRCLPEQRSLLVKVWRDLDKQIGHYIRAKIIHIIIVGIVNYMLFMMFQIKYQVVLAFLVGLSVLIPYIGAVIAAIPVLFVAGLQWGIAQDFYYFIVAYSIFQLLDANILVPLLFSEALNLHPISIIIAVLFFGSIWGFWGIFFSIPLATLIKSILCAWPHVE